MQILRFMQVFAASLPKSHVLTLMCNFFPFQIIPKNLCLSNMVDLDFWYFLEKGKPVMYSICSKISNTFSSPCSDR